MQPKVTVCTECETGAYIVNNIQFSHNAADYVLIESDGNIVKYETGSILEGQFMKILQNGSAT